MNKFYKEELDMTKVEFLQALAKGWFGKLGD